MLFYTVTNTQCSKNGNIDKENVTLTKTKGMEKKSIKNDFCLSPQKAHLNQPL